MRRIQRWVPVALAATVLAGCTGAVTETGADAQEAWPDWAPLPEGEALAWYHSDLGKGEVWGVALAGGDVGDDVVYESGAEDWVRVTSGTGTVVDGMYAGANGRDWELCRGDSLMQVYDFPGESSFVDDTRLSEPTTQVYVYEPGSGCP